MYFEVKCRICSFGISVDFESNDLGTFFVLGRGRTEFDSC